MRDVLWGKSSGEITVGKAANIALAWLHYIHLVSFLLQSFVFPKVVIKCIVPQSFIRGQCLCAVTVCWTFRGCLLYRQPDNLFWLWGKSLWLPTSQMVMVHATSSIALYNKIDNKTMMFHQDLSCMILPCLAPQSLDAGEWGTDKGRSLPSQI